MKILTLTASLLSLTLASRAQTLEQATEGLIPMPVVQTFYGSIFDAGPSGEAVTWDMSSITAGSIMDLSYEPSASSMFTEATVKESYQEDVFIWNRTHYQLSDDALLLWGSEASGLEASDPMQVLAFPCSYGTTWVDPFDFEASGFYTNTGTITGEVDGTGTLAMPYGEVENVIRVKLTMAYVYDEGLGPVNLGATDYVFYRPGLRVPLLAIRQDQSMLTAMDLMGTRWVGATIAMGTDEAVGGMPGSVSVAPNPATTETFVRFDATSGTVLEVVDAMGRSVLTKRINAEGPSFFNERLDLSGFAAGSYCLTLRQDNGKQEVRKLVVE